MPMLQTANLQTVRPLDAPLDLGAAGARAVAQNASVILATALGSVVLDRRLGVSTRALDRPRPVAEAWLRSDIVAALEYGEPRFSVKSIRFEADEIGGRLIPIVEGVITL